MSPHRRTLSRSRTRTHRRATHVWPGLVTGFDPSRWFDQRAATTLPPNIQFGVAAAEMALEDAGWPSSPQGCSATGSKHPDGLSAGPPGDRTGVAIGCGISGVGELLRGAHLLETKGYRRVSPFLVPNALVNMTAGMVAIRRGLRGPNHAASTACATGAHSIGDAFRFVSLGDADVMVCGGADACIEPIVVAGFSRANALTTKYNDDPAAASRPFDVDRSGFVIAEGAGVLVLEELDHAVARGARIYCELRGYVHVHLSHAPVGVYETGLSVDRGVCCGGE
jgi:3-oxoacyl-[acyl-carrier-protein] synthase II